MSVTVSNKEHANLVSWIPAHPCYGAYSMRRYWQALVEATQADDPYEISSVIQPTDIEIPGGIRGKFTRYWQRSYAYPSLIRRHRQGSITHILDHSWSDMFRHIPARSLKVVTVHDLIPLRFPGSLTDAQLKRFSKWVSHIRSADAIISVSEYTKSEIVDLLGIEPQKVSVVPNGVDLIPSIQKFETLGSLKKSPDDLLVGSIGSTLERKNLSILPDALDLAKSSLKRKIRLIRAGSPLPAELAEKLRSKLGEDGLVELGFLTDEDVGRYYRSVDVIVVPSLYEGFGLPVLEGMAARVPVLSSNKTSLPEVGGDFPYYFDPHSPEELASGLVEIALNPPPESRIEAAYQRAASLSWRRSLEGIFSVYDSLRLKHPDTP